jgi:uncharacterized protein YdeI (YjbR/CyaY-like superfamily)
MTHAAETSEAIAALTLTQLVDLKRCIDMGVAALAAAEKAGFPATASLTVDEDGAALVLGAVSE